MEHDATDCPMPPTSDDDDEIDPLLDPEERRVLFAALDSFRQYRHAAHYNITHLRRQSFYSLPSAQMTLLSSPPFSLPKTFEAVDSAIDTNADIAEAALAAGLAMYNLDPSDPSWKGAATPNDMDKVRSTIRQLYRDWSADAAPERAASYTPILAALHHTFSHIPAPQRSHLHVLVPGAGLGRLVFEINRAGYAVQGNELSYHQLLVSNWVLNHTRAAHAHTLFPWALGFSNHVRRADQLRACSVPDAWPARALRDAADELGSELHPFERMAMCAGDFCVLYRQPRHAGAFDAVTTCFFLDTAPNVIAYVETVRHCLKPGGVWINLGPLLWHFDGGGGVRKPASSSSSSSSPRTSSRPSDAHAESHAPQAAQAAQAEDENKGIAESGSFELADDELMHLLAHYGFEVTLHEVDALDAGYIQDPRSMLRNTYRPSFWIARNGGAGGTGLG